MEVRAAALGQNARLRCPGAAPPVTVGAEPQQPKGFLRASALGWQLARCYWPDAHFVNCLKPETRQELSRQAMPLTGKGGAGRDMETRTAT